MDGPDLFCRPHLVAFPLAHVVLGHVQKQRLQCSEIESRGLRYSFNANARDTKCPVARLRAPFTRPQESGIYVDKPAILAARLTSRILHKKGSPQAMANLPEYKAAKIYEMGQRLLKECLQADRTLFDDGKFVWTLENLRALKSAFRPLEDNVSDTFAEKLKAQLKTQLGSNDNSDLTHRLAAEILAVYFLFPSNITAQHKKASVAEVLSWAGLDFPEGCALESALDEQIGSGGMGYNTRRPQEFGFLIDFAIKWKESDESARFQAAEHHDACRDLMDSSSEDANRKQLRHMLLHILFPDYFERIASNEHKRRIAEAFKPLLSSEIADIDDCLYAIRGELERLLDKKSIDFYWSPLSEVWYTSDTDEETGLSMDALRHKKQIVLYGPPGTGKTHRAKEIAERVIRAGLLKHVKADKYFRQYAGAKLTEYLDAHIHRLQLHPAYSYEDFVRGLHLGAGGKTEYRPGFLLRLLEEIKQDPDSPDVPHVLVLDEINRTDLSRTLGECFSLFEDRGSSVKLPGIDDHGKSLELIIPENLYVIGTMNLIDQSIEQMDFALRRRFLWVLCPFDEEAFISAAKYRWERMKSQDKWADRKSEVKWADIEKDFRALGKRAAALNELIHESPHLGAQYEIGHAYLLDVVAFLLDDLGTRPRTFLWDGKDKAKRPVEQLWDLSLKPLLTEYLSGLETLSRNDELRKLRGAFLGA
jgi:5-methylcytosine-specific restriction protein B